jgi:hypothetical protein
MLATQSGATAPCEQELAGLPLGQAQIFVDSLARLLGQFKPDRSTGFLLPDRRAVQTVPVRGDVIDPYRHDVTAPKFAIDREVEQGEIAGSPFELQLCPYRPDMAGP